MNNKLPLYEFPSHQTDTGKICETGSGLLALIAALLVYGMAVLGYTRVKMCLLLNPF